jgi:hypothetical protein
MEVLKQSLTETQKGKATRASAPEEEITVAGDGRDAKPAKTRKTR